MRVEVRAQGRELDHVQRRLRQIRWVRTYIVWALIGAGAGLVIVAAVEESGGGSRPEWISPWLIPSCLFLGPAIAFVLRRLRIAYEVREQRLFDETFE